MTSFNLAISEVWLCKVQLGIEMVFLTVSMC